jgi:hypothetical protein
MARNQETHWFGEKKLTAEDAESAETRGVMSIGKFMKV